MSLFCHLFVVILSFKCVIFMFATCLSDVYSLALKNALLLVILIVLLAFALTEVPK